MIKQYVQGKETDNDLFCAIGRWAISEEVHKGLGVAVTGRTDDTWYVDFYDSKPVGFAQLRILKNKDGHIRYLHADTEKMGSELIKAIIADARQLGITTIFTNDREIATVWAKLGFKKIHKHHGTFCRWEKEIK